MSPDIKKGDFVLLARIPFLCDSIKAGDVIVFHQPYYGTLIKKISHISSGGEAYFVTGSHPLSIDSHQFGPIQRRDILGKVIWHIHQPHRSTPVNK